MNMLFHFHNSITKKKREIYSNSSIQDKGRIKNVQLNVIYYSVLSKFIITTVCFNNNKKIEIEFIT